jgi:hypothetical protein
MNHLIHYMAANNIRQAILHKNPAQIYANEA